MRHFFSVSYSQSWNDKVMVLLCTGFSWVFVAELSCSESACCLACLISSRKDSHDQKRERESEPSPPWRCAWCHRAAELTLRSLSCLSSASTPHPPTAASETQQNKVHALLNMKPFWWHGPLVTDESVTVVEIWVSYFASVTCFYTTYI